MRVLKFFVVLLVVALLVILPCCVFNPVAEVKKTVLLAGTDWNVGGYTVEESVNAVAGIKGTVEWDTFKPTGYEKYPDVVIVEATLSKIDSEGNKHYLVMQYRLNKKTKVVEQGYVGVDEENTGLASMLEFMVLDY